jgi:chloramphenicol-sensitive protein RarD
MKKGVLFAVGAYVIWGLFPAYWKLLQHVTALQLIAHRILWSFVLLFLFILISKQRKEFFVAIKQPRVFWIYLISGILIAGNWLVYVWAVNAGFIVETSLGYFINPLLSVLLGVVLLRERLRLFQWVPIGLAAAGVLYLTIIYGKLPWIALSLAFTFGIYGLVKKLAPLNALHGLTFETGLVIIPAIGFLLVAEFNSEGAFLHTGLVSDLLMIGAGIATSVPLLLFSSAAQTIPLSLVGILQYIAPTLQFLLGVLVYGEPFTQSQGVGFGLVWLALIIYTIEGIKFRNSSVKQPAKV